MTAFAHIISRARALAVAAVVAALPLGAVAQTPGSLIADRITLNGKILTANGNVTAFADGIRLTARQIQYDGSTDQLTISGPIVLTSPDGTVLTATQAQLSQGLQRGLLQGARLILDRRLQLAAARADRDGTLTQLTSVAATSCQVCPGREPLWSIRAGRVVHDSDAKRLWFEQAQIRVRSQPILTLPQMSLPAPGNTRSTGLLRPAISSSAQLGPTLRLPYFWVLSDSDDLTLEPWISQRAASLGLRYRRGFENGWLTGTGLISAPYAGGDPRGYLRISGAAALAEGWHLDGELAAVSDRQVPLDFALPEREEMRSYLRLTRITGRQLSFANLSMYQPLANGESSWTDPMITARLTHQNRHAIAGGLLRWGVSADGYLRRSGVPGSGEDGLRVGADAAFSRNWIFGPGVEARLTTAARIDGFAYADSLRASGMRGQGAAQLALAWPLIRKTAAATHVIEPIAALSYSAVIGTAPANEDSTRARLDSGGFDRIWHGPGEDMIARGARATLGASWTMTTQTQRLRMMVGGILYDQPTGFARSSGLDGMSPGWLAEIGYQMQLNAGGAVTFDARAISAGSALQQIEAQLGWNSARFSLDASHLFLAQDPAIGRNTDLSWFKIGAAWQATPSWNFSGNATYDIASNSPVSARLGADWRNECVSLGISASHSFATLSNVTPRTDYGINFSVEGFSTSTSGLRATRSCSN